jgi:hypothetical protein
MGHFFSSSARTGLGWAIFYPVLPGRGSDDRFFSSSARTGLGWAVFFPVLPGRGSDGLFFFQFCPDEARMGRFFFTSGQKSNFQAARHSVLPNTLLFEIFGHRNIMNCFPDILLLEVGDLKNITAKSGGFAVRL